MIMIIKWIKKIKNKKSDHCLLEMIRISKIMKILIIIII